jgi:hypothetical protein
MNAVNGLVKSVMLVVFAGSLGLVGCGSELSTAPDFGTISQDEPGEVIIPVKGPRVAPPKGFKAESLGGNSVNLTWATPTENGLTAVIELDGMVIAEVSASSTVYLDTMGKPAGLHTYKACFTKGNQASRQASVEIEIRDQGGNDGGRTDDHPELDD